MAPKKKPEPRRRIGLTHDDVMQASVRIDSDLRRRSQLLWDDRSQPTRGPKPGVTPDDVVQAAMQIADEDGLAAVTMNAVATRLGFTTMAIYRYFPNKETLFDAIVDAGMGPPPRPAEPRGDWRSEVAQWARAKRAMLCARPWLAELPFVAAPHGPNWLSWLEAVAEPLATTGLSSARHGRDDQHTRRLYAWCVGHGDLARESSRARHVGTGVGRGGRGGSRARDRRPAISEVCGNPHVAVRRPPAYDGRVVRVRDPTRVGWNRALCQLGESPGSKTTTRLRPYAE